ncbi:hypothetical protein OROMI_033026 [Orobanche minor]
MQKMAKMISFTASFFPQYLNIIRVTKTLQEYFFLKRELNDFVSKREIITLIGSSMADLRDEHGNPIQLTDQYGKPVQLTDEFGNPMHLTGVATTHTAGVGAHETDQPEPAVQQQEQLRRSGSSSSSSSSEDDGQGGRRKKKGLKERIKDTFGGGTHKDKDEGTHYAPATTTPSSKTSTTVPGQTTEHEKKGLMEKIKQKLPGHHHHDH